MISAQALESIITVVISLLYIAFSFVTAFYSGSNSKANSSTPVISESRQTIDLDPLNTLSLPKEHREHPEYPLERYMFSGYLTTRGRAKKRQKFVYFVLVSRCGDYIVKEIKLKSLKTGAEYRDFNAGYSNTEQDTILIESPDT